MPSDPKRPATVTKEQVDAVIKIRECFQRLVKATEYAALILAAHDEDGKWHCLKFEGAMQ